MSNQPKVFGPYSSIRKAEGLYFVAGQVGVDKSGNAPESFEDQFELVIDNYKKRQGAQLERLKAYAKLMRVGRKADEILGL